MELKLQVNVHNGNDALTRFPESLRQAIERGLTRSVALLEREVESNIRSPLGSKPPAEAFGTLAGSVTSEVSEEGGRQVGTVFLAPPADRYGEFVEVGTRPHLPPVNALIPWVQVRFGLSNLKQIRHAAWAVAGAIARRGTKGHFMFTRALEENQAAVVSILEQEIGRELA